MKIVAVFLIVFVWSLMHASQKTEHEDDEIITWRQQEISSRGKLNERHFVGNVNIKFFAGMKLHGRKKLAEPEKSVHHDPFAS